MRDAESEFGRAPIYIAALAPQSLPSPIPVAGLVRAWAPCPGPPGPPGPRLSTAAAACGLVRWPASSLVDVCDLSKFHHHRRSAVSLLLLIRDSESNPQVRSPSGVSPRKGPGELKPPPGATTEQRGHQPRHLHGAPHTQTCTHRSHVCRKNN